MVIVLIERSGKRYSSKLARRLLFREIVEAKYSEVKYAIKNTGSRRKQRYLRIIGKIYRRIISAITKQVDMKNNFRLTGKDLFVLSGGLYLAHLHLRGRKSLDEVVGYLERIEEKCRKIYKILKKKYHLEFLVPVDVNKLEMYGWVDDITTTEDRIYGRRRVVLTLFFKFKHDIYALDRKSEYEPVSFLIEYPEGNIEKLKVLEVYTRVHYDLYSFKPQKRKITILFAPMGHTPIVLDSRVLSLSKNNILKHLADKVWISLTSISAQIPAYKKIKPRVNSLKVSCVLPKTRNNPFVTIYHPYQVVYTISTSPKWLTKYGISI